MPGLAPPRRFIFAHDPETGEPIINSDPVTLKTLPNGLTAGFPFIQKGLVDPDPLEGVEGGNRRPDGFVQSNGLTLKVIDIPPGKQTAVHYTHTIDFLICMQGSLTYTFGDEQTRQDIGPGDIVVQLGNVHQWINEGLEDARLYAIQLPAKGLTVKGEPLVRALGGHRLD